MLCQHITHNGNELLDVILIHILFCRIWSVLFSSHLVMLWSSLWLNEWMRMKLKYTVNIGLAWLVHNYKFENYYFISILVNKFFFFLNFSTVLTPQLELWSSSTLCMEMCQFSYKVLGKFTILIVSDFDKISGKNNHQT